MRPSLNIKEKKRKEKKENRKEKHRNISNLDLDYKNERVQLLINYGTVKKINHYTTQHLAFFSSTDFSIYIYIFFYSSIYYIYEKPEQ